MAMRLRWPRCACFVMRLSRKPSAERRGAGRRARPADPSADDAFRVLGAATRGRESNRFDSRPFFWGGSLIVNPFYPLPLIGVSRPPPAHAVGQAAHPEG